MLARAGGVTDVARLGRVWTPMMGGCMRLLPPTKNKRNRNMPFDMFVHEEGIWRGFGLAPK